MTDGRFQRRLAAILAADVVGYSRLMGRDEEGTLAALKAHRAELIDPSVAAHGGPIVKTTGDGVLVEFPSAVDAVRCAVAIQRGLAERNTDRQPDERIELRIGVNLGDIVIDEGDIFGDEYSLYYAFANFQAGHYGEAGLAAQRAIQLRPGHPVPFPMAVGAAGLAGEVEQASRAVARLRELVPACTAGEIEATFQYCRPEDRARLAAGLRAGGLPD